MRFLSLYFLYGFLRASSENAKRGFFFFVSGRNGTTDREPPILPPCH